jgi:hypothetical protein
MREDVEMDILSEWVELIRSFFSSWQIQTKLDITLFLFHDRIMSLREEGLVPENSLTPPFFIKVPAPSQERERSCMCVFRV